MDNDRCVPGREVMQASPRRRSSPPPRARRVETGRFGLALLLMTGSASAPSKRTLQAKTPRRIAGARSAGIVRPGGRSAPRPDRCRSRRSGFRGFAPARQICLAPRRWRLRSREVAPAARRGAGIVRSRIGCPCRDGAGGDRHRSRIRTADPRGGTLRARVQVSRPRCRSVWRVQAQAPPSSGMNTIASGVPSPVRSRQGALTAG